MIVVTLLLLLQLVMFRFRFCGSELMPKLGRQEGVEVVEMLCNLVERQLAVLVFVRRRNQSIRLCLVFIVRWDQPILQLILVQDSIVVLVEVLLKVTVVSLQNGE